VSRNRVRVIKHVEALLKVFKRDIFLKYLSGFRSQTCRDTVYKNVDFEFVNEQVFKQFVFLGMEIHILLSDNRSEEKVRKYFPLFVWYSLYKFLEIFPQSLPNLEYLIPTISS